MAHPARSKSQQLGSLEQRDWTSSEFLADRVEVQGVRVLVDKLAGAIRHVLRKSQKSEAL